MPLLRAVGHEQAAGSGARDRAGRDRDAVAARGPAVRAGLEVGSDACGSGGVGGLCGRRGEGACAHDEAERRDRRHAPAAGGTGADGAAAGGPAAVQAGRADVRGRGRAGAGNAHRRTPLMCSDFGVGCSHRRHPPLRGARYSKTCVVCGNERRAAPILEEDGGRGGRSGGDQPFGSGGRGGSRSGLTMPSTRAWPPDGSRTGAAGPTAGRSTGCAARCASCRSPRR